MTGVDARQDIPIGHKVALKDMQPGETVLKYGIDIGKVVAPIKAGEHAHVQNIKTKRWLAAPCLIEHSKDPLTCQPFPSKP